MFFSAFNFTFFENYQKICCFCELNVMKKYVTTDESRFALLQSVENNDENDESELMTNYEEFGIGTAAENGRTHSQNNGHCHSLLLSQKEEKSSEKTLWVLVAISALHISVQMVGGVLANSLSIIADSGHILTDLVSFLISIFMLRISVVNSNRRFTFGHFRAEFIGAMASIFIIWTITILMIVFATQRVASGQMTVDTRIMLITALVGIVFNAVMALFLKWSKDAAQFSHGHSHFIGGSSANGAENSQRENVNVRAAFVHILGDFIQSVGVLSAALLIRWTDFQLADPICTYFFSLVVLCTSVPVARDIFMVFMESTPPFLDYDVVRNDLCAISSVNGVHSLHLWAVGTERSAAIVHLVIDDESKVIEVTKAATKLLQNGHKIHFTTIQTEISEPIHAQCKFCKTLQ